MTAAPAIIHVVDDDPSFRTAMSRLLSVCGYQVRLYESATRLLDQLPSPELGCILLDVRMPGLNGPELQRRLAEVGCKLPIIFLSGYGDIPTTVRTIKAGAEDFLAKPVRKQTLLEAIERAIKNYEEARGRDEQVGAFRDLVSRLTPREREVFALVVRGKLNKQIAFELGTTERTVKAHRHNVMQKCEVQSVAELVLIAERLDLLSEGSGTEKSMEPVAQK